VNPGARSFTDEDLEGFSTPLSIHLERAADREDWGALAWIVDQADMECLAIYDAYVNWMGVLQTFIVERAGEPAHDQALGFAAEYAVRPFVHQYAGLDARGRALKLAQRLRASGSTFRVEEEDRLIRFRLDPWGPVRWWRRPAGWESEEPRRRDGDRFRYPSYGAYDPPLSFATLSGARPLTQGRETLPSFLATEVQFLEIVPVEVLGAPIAVITLGDGADEPVCLDVHRDPSHIPDEAFSRIGLARPDGVPGEPAGRAFSDEELDRLATPLSLQIQAAGEARDATRLRAIAAHMDVELVGAKDPLGIFIAALLSWIAWHLGEDAAEAALERTAEVVMAPFLGAVRDLAPADTIPMWSMVWRAHGSTFSVEEHADTFVFRGRPLGACHRMWSHAYQREVERISDGRVRYPTFGCYDPPTSFHLLRRPRPISRGRSGYPIYSCHCHMLHTIYPIDHIGRPLWVEEHPLHDRDGDTVHIHYKDPGAWPARYYEEVGRSKPAAKV